MDGDDDFRGKRANDDRVNEEGRPFKKLDLEDALFGDPELPNLFEPNVFQRYERELAEFAGRAKVVAFATLSVEEAELRRREQTLFPSNVTRDAARMLTRALMRKWVNEEGLNAFQVMKLSAESAEVRRYLSEEDWPWHTWFEQDFPDVVACSPDRGEPRAGKRKVHSNFLPVWILNQDPATLDPRYKAVPWRRYYVWTCFFARRSYKEILRIHQDISARTIAEWNHRREIVGAMRTPADIAIIETYNEWQFIYGLLVVGADYDEEANEPLRPLVLATVVPIDLRSPINFRNPKWFLVQQDGQDGRGDVSMRVTVAGDMYIIGDRYEDNLAQNEWAPNQRNRPGIDPKSLFRHTNVHCLFLWFGRHFYNVSLDPMPAVPTSRNPLWEDLEALRFEELFAEWLQLIHDAKPAEEFEWKQVAPDEWDVTLIPGRRWSIGPMARLNFDYPRAMAAYVVYCETTLAEKPYDVDSEFGGEWQIGADDEFAAAVLDSARQRLRSNVEDEWRMDLMRAKIRRMPVPEEQGDALWPTLSALPAAPMIVDTHPDVAPGLHQPTLFIGNTTTEAPLFCCSRCHQGSYRSKHEQRKDWPRHRLQCKIK